MKRSIFIIIVFVLSGLILVQARNIYSVKEKPQTIKSPENKISIAHQEVFGSLDYGRVIFEHQKHIDSLSKVLKKSDSSICSECHSQNKYGDFIFDFPKDVNRKNPESLKNAYHKECLKCHQKLNIQKQKSGPTILSCRDCHKKDYEKTEIKYSVFEFDFALHDKHVKKHNKDCSLCHHIYDVEEKNKELALFYEKGTEQSCHYCHDLNQKRGPELSKIVKIAKERDLNMERACHTLCLNCHLSNKEQGKQAGPVVCSKCHTEKYKTVEDLKDIPRPEREQPQKAFINIEDAKMKGVAFDHSFHEKNNKTCRECHHETLRACKDCHTVKGDEKGGFVNLLTAYHSLNSKNSCQGCHRTAMNKNDCYGCHYFISPVTTEIANKAVCKRCHTGKKEIEKVSLLTIPSERVKKEVVIKHIEKEFEATKMPHYKMIQKLTDVSNQSKLATYFHRDITTICRVCHHKSKQDAEAKKDNPPICVSCHSVSFDSNALGRPRLESAYHTMCIKCHENMKLEKPKKCTECHERKKN